MPVIRFWGTEAGLPQNTVTAIEQTRDGYLWLGTHDGLARFDGVRFEPFGLEHGLQSVDITTLLEDRAGTLWVGTYGGGLGRWHEGRIETIPYAGHQPGLASINCLAEDGTGRLWVGTAGGLRLCQTNTLIEDPALAPLDHLLIRCLLLDH
ncbi:MAG TPA: two-component regulator propeller domain-containing protein, partial [Verrucomicrobiae bacterium]|nr:two-component regulator propeller domain-containing protein [Verrucomicrobiae bacterium]